MDTYPPAHSPTSAASPARPVTDPLTADMLDSLRGTKPWVRLISIVGFIGVGFMLLLSVFIIGAGLLGAGDEQMPGFLLAGMGLLYLLMAFLYIFPSLYLFRYASAIKRAMEPGSKTIPVQDALRYQKSFWKFVGILTLVMLLLYIPGVLAAIAIPNLMTAVQRSKQKRTMADIMTLATAVEAYAVDTNQYPEGPLDTLPSLLESTYVKVMPRLDGWGNELVYSGVSCTSYGCQGYVIVSGGKNGELELDLSRDLSSQGGPTTNFDEDIAYMNGSFVAWPEGYE